MIESLTTTSGIFQEKLQQKNEQLEKQLEEQANESKKFIQDNLEAQRVQGDKLAKLEIEYRNLVHMSKSDQKSYIELKEAHEKRSGQYEEKAAELARLKLETDSLGKKLSECASLHKLEMHELRVELENVNSELTMRLRDEEEKAGRSGRRCGELEAELRAAVDEVSSLRGELSEMQDDLVSQRSEWSIKGAEEVASMSAKAAKFELMYNDEVAKVKSVSEQLERKIKEVKMGSFENGIF